MNRKTVHNLGIVVIGRNEGERLVACLDSLAGLSATVVYVDSESGDDSVAMAKARGVEVVQLSGEPLTAARSRNAGWQRMIELNPNVELVQFIDGDCRLAHGWLPAAIEALSRDDSLAVVCGRRRERFPDRSVYNRLCDMEWNTPVGRANACGGDALMRVMALRGAGGFDERLIAGEEPELCFRLRQCGWHVARIDLDMTFHDARMTRFVQWWKRMVRSGHAVAEGMAMHGRSPERYCVRQVKSILAWGAALPIVALALAAVVHSLFALLLLMYPALWARVVLKQRRRGEPWRAAALYASFCVLGKFPQAQGVGQYWLNRLRGRRTRLIEYKGVSKQPRTPAMSFAKGGGS